MNRKRNRLQNPSISLNTRAVSHILIEQLAYKQWMEQFTGAFVPEIHAVIKIGEVKIKRLKDESK
jgi:hypothetical protein